jgi:hypothetical protein
MAVLFDGRLQCIINRDLQLILLKRLVNVPLRFVDRIVPEPDSGKFPQTQMMQHIYERMFKVYRLDCLQGTFGKQPDGNFERLLRVSRKVLVRLSEDDPYYRKWVGLTFLLAANEWENREKDPGQLKRLIKEQWHMNIDFLSDDLVASCVDDFSEDALCDFLGNLARKEVGEIPAFLDQKTIGGIKLD